MYLVHFVRVGALIRINVRPVETIIVEADNETEVRNTVARWYGEGATRIMKVERVYG